MSTNDSPTSPSHERFLMLVEKDMRGELADAEHGELERHLAACEECRAYAAQTKTEDQTMLHAIESVHAKCNFERIEQAITNRQLLERGADRVTVVLVAAGALGAPIAWWLGVDTGYVSGLVAITLGMGVYGLYRLRLRKHWHDLAERSNAGDPLAFESFHRSARSHLALQQAGLLAMLFAVPVVGVTGISKLLDGQWLLGGWFTLSALLMAPFVPLMWKSVFSRKGRRHDEALMTGEIAETRFRKRENGSS